ncbi:MBOAT family O-acyltransferase [Clostridium intestinale]|uniref:Protein AlgI2 n=1 Tax=Clostridium intestinale URNW TaxID=1294142 RepID=U2PUJ7_9CLOT|nr:MBOAT family O-acyltransferase [Clostridium intestinale]ERK30095.1 protein AlgI2 [Clostridium intestinale URNW]
MSFSSIEFIFMFLPIIIISTYCMPNKLKNTWLLILSIVFYSIADFRYLFLIIITVLINYLLGFIIGNTKKIKVKNLMLLVGIFYNLGILSFYKYINFLIENINGVFNIFGLVNSIEVLNIVLPIGISFYLFQCISYLIDVYRGDGKAEKNIINLALYITFFPQIFSGPIMKYKDMSTQLTKRVYSSEIFIEGTKRFIFGLFKKLIIANTLAITADKIFALNSSELGTSIAWLGVITYTLQIYFDFSAYSDMAIGIGRMLGFKINENFNYPYAAKSIKDFWNRWHISLSTWFREYLYFPLGGNRKGKLNTYRNLFIVFFLCGLWHGAKWNFIIWGIYYGVILILERINFLGKFSSRIHPIFKHAYTLLIIGFGWVLFRAESFEQIKYYIRAMVGLSPSTSYVSIYSYLNSEVALTIMIAIIFAMPVQKIIKSYKNKSIYTVLKPITLLILFFISIMYLLPTTESSEIIKFIYTQF